MLLWLFKWFYEKSGTVGDRQDKRHPAPVLLRARAQLLPDVQGPKRASAAEQPGTPGIGAAVAAG